MQAQFMELMLSFVYKVQNHIKIIYCRLLQFRQHFFSGISKDSIMLSCMFKKQHKKAQSACILGVAEILAVLSADIILGGKKLVLKGAFP